MAQSEIGSENIDPRLVEIIEIVKSRTALELELVPDNKPRDEIYLDHVDYLQTAFYTGEITSISEATKDFVQVYNGDAVLDLSRIPELYRFYSLSLQSEKSSTEMQESFNKFSENGNWFERYLALSLSAHLHATEQERQSALQKAQLALSIIPDSPGPRQDVYVKFAKARIASLIAQLHNLQGNSELALSTSLDYLRLMDGNPDLKSEVDLINNLIYSYSIGRNHEAQLYLTEQLLEIEKTHTSSVPGLSEMRISGVMNSSGRFADALEYAELSIDSATNPIVLRVSQVNKATALAGLGRIDDARETAKLAEVNFAREHMLQTETRQGDLYLAFLLAQAEDHQYATQLFNRQLDVTAQKFLENNSRDTTAMLAALENTRERQAERDAATAREADLQAITIIRQRTLNRTLMVISVLLGLAALAAILFTRFRGRVMRKLAIKTKEAASAEKLKTEFLGMISHELRTPLNGIIGISDYLANYHEDEDIRTKTGIVLKSGNELLSVVESLTDMARIDAGQIELVLHDADLAVSLAGVPENWAQTAADKGLTFTHFIDPAITRHHVDEDRILQCVNILLSNAISFTDSGRVHLHVTLSKAAPHELTVVVADTGQGMSELVQSRLFTPFMQADASRKRTHMGTGLSLAIAYALVEMMEGTLSCVSRDGRGSEFTFAIPLRGAIAEPQAPALIEATPPQAETTEALNLEDIALAVEVEASAPQAQDSRPVSNRDMAQPPAAPARQDFVDLMAPSDIRPSLHDYEETEPLLSTERPLRVLVVDDMVSNRDVLSLMLESKGFICREAADGYAALAALERQAFDLIILDIHMAPLDGIETLRRIRASGSRYANIAVIALTADNAARINAETMDAGADLFLTKPIKQEELLRAISRLRGTDATRILSQQA